MLTHESRQPRPWLICNVGQTISHEHRNHPNLPDYVDADESFAYADDPQSRYANRKATHDEVMKKLGDIWAEYRDYTSDFTQHSRALGFAGAGVCWLFKSEGFRFPLLIYLALLSFVSYFSLDICQMFVAALARRVYARRTEKKILGSGAVLDPETKVPFPPWIDAAPFCFFILKGIALAFGFAFIAFELLKRIVEGA